jgi:hypothetical protein
LSRHLLGLSNMRSALLEALRRIGETKRHLNVLW